MRGSMTENDLANAVEKHLLCEGWTVFREVPLLARCVDMIALSGADEIMAIEFKLDNWRRAIAQARDHTIACDSVVICMPTRRNSDAMLRALDEEGIGLFSYCQEDDALDRILMPRSPAHTSPIARKWLENAIEARAEGGDR